jgi:hypothetical protein
MLTKRIFLFQNDYLMSVPFLIIIQISDLKDFVYPVQETGRNRYQNIDNTLIMLTCLFYFSPHLK